MLGPVIKGERITLGPAREDLLPEFIRWFQDMKVTRYLLARTPMSLPQEQDWFANMTKDQSSVHWTIFVDDRAIGVSGIHQINWMARSAHTGTIIGVPEEWGKGYASEAVRLRTRFAFEELNLNRLESSSMAPNVGMHRALEKVGHRRVGVFRDYLFREGQYVDAVIFELLRKDWVRQ